MKIKMRWKFKTGRAVENLATFESLIARSLVESAARTLVNAIQTRYSKARKTMGKIERYPEPIPADTPPSRLERLDAVSQALDEAALERIGRFNEVISLIVNQNYFHIQRDEHSMTLGIGYIPSLDEVQSPSATPIIYGVDTRTPYGILWRQMEFGMGVTQRKAYPGPIALTRSSSKQGWWYGPKTPSAGIHFKGTQPGNFLRDQTGLPYSQDSVAFHDLFHKQFTRLFNG